MFTFKWLSCEVVTCDICLISWNESQMSSSCLLFVHQWECAWFVILCSTFSLLLFWAYFWLEAHNDYNQFNWWVGQFVLTRMTVSCLYHCFRPSEALSLLSGFKLVIKCVHISISPRRACLFHPLLVKALVHLPHPLSHPQVTIQPFWGMEGRDCPHSGNHRSWL
jgi:hypothetical protein